MNMPTNLYEPDRSIAVKLSSTDTAVAATPIVAVREASGLEAGMPELMPVMADHAVCAACLQEMLDPYARRYRYSFIHCHDCGPFFVESIRSNDLQQKPCALCRHEAADRHNRRYGLNGISCYQCGPRVQLQRCDGRAFCMESFTMLDAIDALVSLLQRGHIVKVQGHTCSEPEWLCDVAHPQAMAWLQQNPCIQATCVLVRDAAMARQSVVRQLLTTTVSEVTPNHVSLNLPLHLPLYLPLLPLHALLFQRFARPILSCRQATASGTVQEVDYQLTYQFRQQDD